LNRFVILAVSDSELDVNRFVIGIAVFRQLKAAVDVLLIVIQTQLKKPFNGMSNLEGEYNNVISKLPYHSSIYTPSNKVAADLLFHPIRK
jgi:hypothetical protein